MREPGAQDQAWREFHVSRAARDHYGFDQGLFATNGNVVVANFSAARTFAQKMNVQRDLVREPEKAVRASQINAMGLLDEVLHYVVARYRDERNSQALAQALSWLETNVGADAVDATLRQFVQEFPPVAVYQSAQAPEAYLAGETDGVPNRQIALEELVMLWLSNLNPALAPYLELFDDQNLETKSAYMPILTGLRGFFDTQPPFGPDNQNLIDMLRAPALAVPGSLTGQLQYILARWGDLTGPLFQRLLTGLDFVREEEKPVFAGPGPSIVPRYGPGIGGRSGRSTAVGWDEPERFSTDLDWMPQVVMIAKNTYVWLDQLSRQYGRHIRTLDQIPDEELDRLARSGFTALWLIGLWERSLASRRIKQMCGNPDAVASAYSLHDYDIAADLGGPEAMHNLRERAGQRGLRMASDMVPNHMAIDSRWVSQHPDWFLALDHSPFPTYSFNGPNLSRDDRVGIYLEDHYYSKSDAAVVFKRVDNWTGSEKYIYHGNDGTSMPWNDTAQLNYLKAEVREAVIQTILHVARQFPIIRFDAAMTLAKRHIQRLWFPEPGHGGAIPSRSEHGLGADDFNAAMPEEFWREVVDRVAAEVPDTLLLAEAFWMMEGYFVRTLGMHRVYNSAFMNMLRDEENLKYRAVLKNTLEFDPDILKRFVNFMNNPDEKTAVEQFGKDGKYFGVCTLMATLPGLPMFGHGQLEGFAEKYGMEYQRAYWDEPIDGHLMERHEREIFPLLKRRYLFAEVRNFLLYDFWIADGSVNEDVFAYSNRCGDERALIVYHNRFAEAHGWIRTSVGSIHKGAGVRQVVQKTLGDGLGIRHGADWFTILRDNVTGLEYIRNNNELCDKGLYVELAAYESHVFLDFREVQESTAHRYAQLTASLNGRGVPSIDIALAEIVLEPVLAPFRAVANAATLQRLLDARPQPQAATPATPPAATKPAPDTVLDDIESGTTTLADALHACYAQSHPSVPGDAAATAHAVRHRVAAALRLADSPDELLQSRLTDDRTAWPTLLAWSLVHDLGHAVTTAEPQALLRDWLDEWLLGLQLQRALQEFGLDPGAAEHAVRIVKVLTTYSALLASTDPAEAFTALFADPDGELVVAVNVYGGVRYFNKEAFEQLLWWLHAAATVSASLHNHPAPSIAAIERLQSLAGDAGYEVERFLARL